MCDLVTESPTNKNISSCQIFYISQIDNQECCRIDMTGLENTEHDNSSSLLTMSVLSPFPNKVYAKTIYKYFIVGL